MRRATSNSSTWSSAQSGEVLKVRLKDLIPTQACVGFHQIYYHLGRKQPNVDRFPLNSGDWVDYMEDSERKRGDAYCEDSGMGGIDSDSWVPNSLNMSDGRTFACVEPEPSTGSSLANELKTVVVGPGAKLYLTDGHHTFNTLMELADGGPELQVFVRVTDNWIDAPSMDEFWARMEEKLYLWLRDAQDQPITIEELPASLGLSNFQDDPFRTLVRLTKDMAYGGDGLPPFVEFKWGSWLRRKGLDLSRYNMGDLARARIEISGGEAVPRPSDSLNSYVALVRDAAILMVSAGDGEIIDDGQNATTLGKLSWPSSAGAWNDMMEDEVWRSDLKSSGSPRKGARQWYALNYARCGGAASRQPDCWHGSGSLTWN